MKRKRLAFKRQHTIRAVPSNVDAAREEQDQVEPHVWR
jgi:hypothetical protein